MIDLRKREPLLATIVLALAALPILLVAHPPVMDFPNHLARIQLLAGGLAEPVLGSMYRADWAQASTNVAVDAVAVGLARLLPFGFVSTLLMLAMILGPALAGAALHRKLVGRASGWVAIFAITAFSTTAVAGFLSFQVSLAAGLLSATLLHRRLTRAFDWSTIALHVATCALLLLIHPFGLFLYAATAAGIVLGPKPLWPLGRARMIGAGLRIALLAVGAVVPVALLFLLAPHPPGGSTGTLWPALGYMLHPLRIVHTMASPFVTYSYPIDGLFAAVTAVAVVAAMLVKGARLHWGVILAAAAIGSGGIWAPLAIGDASWLQQRFAIMAALMLFAAVEPGDARPGWRRAIVALVVVTALARLLWIGSVWRERGQDAADVLAVGRALPAGAALIVVQQDTPEAEQHVAGRYLQGGVFDPELAGRHLPALLVGERRVFLPTLFTIPGQHPLSVQPAWASRSVTSSPIPRPAALTTPSHYDPYALRWRRDFDYLLLIGADQPAATPLPPVLIPVARQGYAALYRIPR